MTALWSKRTTLLLTVALGLGGCKTASKEGPGRAQVPICNPQPTFSLDNVPLYPQEEDNWCWAASSQMIMKQLGVDVAQCKQASDRIPGGQCCPTGTNLQACDLAVWPDFARYGITCKNTVPTNGALSFDQLKNQLGCLNKPVAFSWLWDGGGGHMMVAVGYVTSSANGTNLVEVNDPLQVGVGSHRFISYNEYRAAPGNHSHWGDYYDFQKTSN